LPQQSPTLPRGLEGGNPLCVKFFLGKIFYQNDLRAFGFRIDSGILKTSRAEGLLRLRDTDTSLITFRTEPRDSYAFGIRIPHSPPSARSNSRSNKRSCYRTSLNTRVENNFRAFSTVSITESYDQMRVHVSGKADRAERLLRL
jgi:hypothetical protein